MTKKTLLKLWDVFEFVVGIIVCTTCLIPVYIMGSFFEYMNKRIKGE